MNRLPFYIFAMVALLCFCVTRSAYAACAKVSIEILQELTIERTAFDAKLVVTNGIPDQSLQDIRVDVVVRDNSGNLKNDLFFVRTPTLSGIGGALDGSGSVIASGRGEAHWLIIPSPGAGYIEQDGAIKQIGVDYWVGATLTYTVNGQQENVAINPAKITVKPMPQLVLDYFMPSAVLGDNPFTTKVEAPVPYPLGVRVLNDGYGVANKLRIDSAQPKIVDNKQGLLIDFRLLGASVNDSAVTPSLSVNFGDLASKKVATAAWQMISTLSGRFVEFKTSFTHSSELGGEMTSLIRETNAHFLTHKVKVNLPGRDSKLDFLADVNDTTGAIFESEIPNGSTVMSAARTPVTVILPAAAPVRPTADKPAVALNLPTGNANGWIYTKMADPSQGMQKLKEVTRSDGVHLDPNNFWVDEGLDKDYKKNWTLQFIDYRADVNTTGAYTLTYTKPDVDTIAPTTTLIFDGPSVGTAPAYITPQTRLLLTATDNDGGSGVDAMYRKVSNLDSDFIPALPFNLTDAGDYTVQFYSTDRAGNVEAVTSATVKVIASAPTINGFTATPASFAPQSPKGVVASRTVGFVIKAASQASSLPVEIDIASGTTFQPGSVIRTLKGTATSGTDLHLDWDGKDISGKLVATGSYTARLKVSDGLDNLLDATAPSHTVTKDLTVTATEWFNAGALDPNPAADQQHPRISGTKVVWQDQRNGVWDIYIKDASSGSAASMRIPGTSAGRERPAMDGNFVVWQDQRNGGWEIYGYDLAAGQELAIATGTGDKQRPTVSGDWVAWQDYRNNNWDIFAKNIKTNEVIQVTNHERDQLHPVLFGTTLVWEDYRHGPGEVYAYDLVARTERQVAAGSADLFGPVVGGNIITWADRRNGQADIYTSTPARSGIRMTYGTGDHVQPALNADLLVFADYETSSNDPNLSFRVLSSGVGGRLVSDPARQEEPAVGTGIVVWQDTRDGKYQIYTAALQTESLPIEVSIKPGYNLIAAGSRLATASSTAAAFLTANKDALGVDRLLAYDHLHNTYTEANVSGGDFAITKGMGLTLYSTKAGALTVADAGETSTYTLLPGVNQIGLLAVPYGYSVYDLMKSLGLDNVQSVRRFDSDTGAWRSVVVRTGQGGNELIGSNFTVNPGDGLIITMKNRVDGWAP